MPKALLYDRWRATAAAGGSREAMREIGSGRSWSFAELDRAVQAFSGMPGREIHAPRGAGVDFLLETIAAWRDDAVLAPLEEKAALPEGLSARDLPAGVRHLKITSGTTGAPKLVLFRPEQLLADVDQIVSTMGLHPGMPNVAAISLAHSYGFSNLVLPLLTHGVPLILTGSVLPRVVQSAFSQAAPPVTLPAVPALWRAWLEAGILDRDRIALAISAGAPLATQLERRVWEESGIKIHNFYGSSETGGIAYDRSRNARAETAVVGTALDGVRLSVSDDRRLLVQSAACGYGYIEGEGVVETFAPGEFLLPDEASLNSEGIVRLLGRTSQTINVAGRKLSPVIVEEALGNIAAVRHAVVFGVPSANAERAEDVVAVVAIDDSFGSLSEVQAEVKKLLPDWQVPRHWWVCENLAPNPRGKFSRQVWRERFLQRRSSRRTGDK